MKNTNPKDLLNQTIKRMDGAYADSTTRAYRVDFEHLINYCKKFNESPLPTTPETICLYIKSLIQDGRSSASIRRVMAGMTTIHKLNRFPDTTKDPDIILEIRRMHRIIGRYQKQALGVTAEILEELLLAPEAGNRGIRDRAFLLVAYDTMCRRSELVSLLIEDIRYSENNRVTEASVLIRKSKTDQLAKGRRLNLSQKSN